MLDEGEYDERKDCHVDDLPPYHSASQLNNFIGCAFRYFLRYTQKMKAGVDDGLAAGLVLHKTREAMLRNMKMPDEKLIDIAGREVASFLKAPDYVGDPPELEKRVVSFLSGLLKNRPARRPLKENDRWALSEHLNREVDGIEFGFLIEIPGLDKPVIGFIDSVEESQYFAQNGKVNIVDLKTSTRAKNSNDVFQSMQMRLYQWALEQLGLEVDSCVFEVVTPKGGQDVAVQFQKNHLSQMLAAYKFMESALKAGHFPPNPGMQCSWCDFKTECSKASGITSFVV